ncbi:MAG: gas vesicle protein GvpG [Proteobacteria bacterium]|nr:gas vesicle protein GvpG [Pseudomonadota bacterium]
MLIIDDLLFFPVRSILWTFREIYNAAQEDVANEAEAITAELGDLYMMLETGKITEAEFDQREKDLLDRLEEIQARGSLSEDEEEEG